MKTYLVGGAVRDQLLGLPVVERDWVVVGSTPEEMASLGYRQVGRDFPVFLHPETSEEYALARTERKTGPGHTGFVCRAGPEVTLTEDLERRDLTINAIALDDTGALIDPWGGHADLNARILRHVSPAFSEDPLRVFRVARFAARFHDQGFLVADETLALMRAMASDGELAELSAERVWAEFDKSLRTDAPSVFARVLEDAHALTPWFAELTGATEETGVLLDRAAAAGLAETYERFATLGWHLEAPLISALAARLKAPKRHARLAQQIAEHGRTLVNWRSAADDAVLEALTAVNAFRLPEWLAGVVAVLSVCARLDTSGLLALADELRAVDPATLIQQGYKGAALGEALADRRREAIANRRVAPS